ncbi:MAG: tetratricopeptide repeat protein [Candidatus Nealsonbacteria bacterium]
MNIGVVFFYIGLGIGNLLILTEWAKKGFWEVGLEGPRNKRAVTGWIIGVGTIVISGIAYRINGFYPINKWGIILVYAIPILIAFFVRATMPAGQRQFNVAKTRMNFWMSPKYYQPGRFLPVGNDLQQFPRAQQTVRAFQTALVPYQKDTSLRGRLNLAIGYEELGMMYRLMNARKEAADSYWKSIAAFRHLTGDDPKSREVHTGLSMALFRKAELDHCLGNFAEAIRGYQESLGEGAETDSEGDVNLTERLIEKAKINQN